MERGDGGRGDGPGGGAVIGTVVGVAFLLVQDACLLLAGIALHRAHVGGTR